MDRLTNRNIEIPLPRPENADYWRRVHLKLAAYEDAEEQGLLVRLPLNEWIPVTERLPGRERVLCKCRANIYEVLSLRDGSWYHDSQHQYMSGFVTHWMPLPEPPEEG